MKLHISLQNVKMKNFINKLDKTEKKSTNRPPPIHRPLIGKRITQISISWLPRPDTKSKSKEWHCTRSNIMRHPTQIFTFFVKNKINTFSFNPYSSDNKSSLGGSLIAVIFKTSMRYKVYKVISGHQKVVPHFHGLYPAYSYFRMGEKSRKQ